MRVEYSIFLNCGLKLSERERRGGRSLPPFFSSIHVRACGDFCLSVGSDECTLWWMGEGYRKPQPISFNLALKKSTTFPSLFSSTAASASHAAAAAAVDTEEWEEVEEVADTEYLGAVAEAAATDALLSEKVPKPVYEKWGQLKGDARSKYGARPARLKGMPAHQLPHMSEAQLLPHMLPVQLLRESVQRANGAHQNLHLTLHGFFKWLGLWLLMSLYDAGTRDMFWRADDKSAFPPLPHLGKYMSKARFQEILSAMGHDATIFSRLHCPLTSTFFGPCAIYTPHGIKTWRSTSTALTLAAWTRP